eukprot:1154674-Pelagomonas_calceolata.AAC.2
MYSEQPHWLQQHGCCAWRRAHGSPGALRMRSARPGSQPAWKRHRAKEAKGLQLLSPSDDGLARQWLEIGPRAFFVHALCGNSRT